MLDNFVSPYDATVVEKLAAAGAVVLGKSNMDEFAMGSSNRDQFFRPGQPTRGICRARRAVRPAARPLRWPRACAPVATGTDTGGSIRQPAALTGVTVGIKPTYGRVSRYGMIAFASSLDQAGMISR